MAKRKDWFASAAKDLEVPEGKSEVVIWDQKGNGLGLRARKSGRKSFIFQYRIGGRGAKTQKITIGPTGTYDVDDAREEALEYQRQVRKGVDPKQAKRDLAERETMQGLCEKFITVQEMRGDKRSRHAEERRINKNILNYKISSQVLMRDMAVADITHDHIEALHLSMSSRPIEANRTRAVMSALFEFAISKELRADNPTKRVRPFPEVSRDHFLDADHIKWFWQACANTSSIYGTFGQVLLLTGARRGEIAGMRWDEIDDNGVLTIPAERSKNKQPQRVYLSPVVRSLLSGIERKGDYVFTTTGVKPINGFQKSKKAIIRDMRRLADGEVEHWNWHDLRRTFATGMQSIGVNSPVISALQGQKSHEQTGVASIYQRYDFDAEKKQAMEAWSNLVGALGTGEEPNVVKLEVM